MGVWLVYPFLGLQTDMPDVIQLNLDLRSINSEVYIFWLQAQGYKINDEEY